MLQEEDYRLQSPKSNPCYHGQSRGMGSLHLSGASFCRVLLLLVVIHRLDHHHGQALSSSSSSRRGQQHSQLQTYNHSENTTITGHQKLVRPFLPGDPGILLNHEALQILEDGKAYIMIEEIDNEDESEATSAECEYNSILDGDHHPKQHCNHRRTNTRFDRDQESHCTRRMVIAQDIHAPPKAIWDKLLDFNHYKQMVPTNTINDSHIYQRMPLHQDKRQKRRAATSTSKDTDNHQKAIEAIHAQLTIGFSQVKIWPILRRNDHHDVFIRYEYHPSSNSLIWSLDYARHRKQTATSDGILKAFNGHWHVIPYWYHDHPTDEMQMRRHEENNHGKWCRVYYIVQVSIAHDEKNVFWSKVPTSLLNSLLEHTFLTYQGSLGWLKQQSEFEVAKLAEQKIELEKANKRKEVVEKLKAEIDRLMKEQEQERAAQSNHQHHHHNLHSRRHRSRTGSGVYNERGTLKEDVDGSYHNDNKENSAEMTLDKPQGWTTYSLLISLLGMVLYNLYLLLTH